MSDPEEIVERIREQFRIDPDQRPLAVVAGQGVDPDRWLPVAEAIANGEDPDLPNEDLNQQTGDDDSDVLVNDEADPEPAPVETPDGPVDSWFDAGWRWPRPSVWSPEHLNREQWMGHSDKKPFAPWGDKDTPAPCSETGHTDASECDCDARFKWGYEPQYVDGETVAMGEDDPRLDGRVFLQTDEDPYAFVDGDDVRDPETGEVHPAFVEILEQLGISYADISTSGAGVHVYYRGELPNDIPQASWPIDDEPWGSNDEEPAIEIYANKHVCVATGDHVPGSGTEVNEWDAEALEAILNENDQLRQTVTDRSDIDLSGYEPDATGGEETTTEIRDQFYAINRLDSRKVAEETIVQQWNDDASTSSGARAFYPTWGSSSDSGTANYVDEDIWNDTGHNGGYGGALVMALIDAGEISNVGAAPQDASGSAYFTAVEHLRDLGFDIPKLEGDDDRPALDILSDEIDADRDATAEAEAAAVAGPDETPAPTETSETDGGATAAESGSSSTPITTDQQFQEDVHSAIAEANDEVIQHKTARHRIAFALTDHYDFVYPEDEVRGWRSTLYVYNSDEGVYEPRGEQFIDKKLERVAGDYVTNTVVNEITGKVERMTIERGDAFEPIPERLVVANGILNLHTGELDNWTPLEYHRQKIDIRWNPDTDGGGEIEEFFNDIVEGRDVDTLYRVIAHALYKEYVSEKAIMLVGGGQNGKSVFLSLVEQFLGQWNVSHRALQDFDDNDFAANALEGKLANIHPDMGDQAVTDMSMFKKLTGRDTMMANVKFETPITFENFATLMFAANEMPQFSEDNHAVWRRWVYINFPYTFDDTDPEAKDSVPKRVLMRRLTDDAELEALLVRCQQEIQQWYEGRDWYPDTMGAEEVRKQMKKAAEPVFDFATTCLQEADDDEFLDKEDVRKVYRAYATEQGLPKIGADRFGEQLVNFPDYSIDSARRREDGGRQRVYTGVQWSSRGRQVAGLDDPDDEQQSQVGDDDMAVRQMLDKVRDLVDDNGGDPVTKDMIIGACMSTLGVATAKNAFEHLKTKGEIMEGDDGWLPTS